MRFRALSLPYLQPQPAAGGRHPPGQRTRTHPARRVRPCRGRGPQAAGDSPPDVRGNFGGRGHPHPDLQPAGRAFPVGCGHPERHLRIPDAEAGQPTEGQALCLLYQLAGRAGAEPDSDQQAAPRPAHARHPQAAEERLLHGVPVPPRQPGNGLLHRGG